ncbi:MAG: CDP-alcohol phosphatidyltransferase family protein, partial [Chloroflexota bacterium]
MRFTSLSDWLRYQTRGLTVWLGQTGIRLGLHPDTITVLGLVVVMVGAWLAARGDFLASGIVLILGMPLDVLDGAIARAMNRQNRFGALLDSTLDRYADGFMFFALAYYFAVRGQINEMMLAIVALIGAYAVSY